MSGAQASGYKVIKFVRRQHRLLVLPERIALARFYNQRWNNFSDRQTLFLPISESQQNIERIIGPEIIYIPQTFALLLCIIVHWNPHSDPFHLE